MGQDVRANITDESGEVDAPLPACPRQCSSAAREADALADRERQEIAQAQEDPFAFAPLYERYVDAIFGYCYRRTSDREQAADLTSQIFVKALAAIGRFDPQPGGATFRSWLFSIAHNHVVDAHRLRRQHASLDLDDHDRDRESDRPRQYLYLTDTGPSPEDHALASEQRRELGEAMAALTDGQRQIVELRLAGLTGPEIAAVLEMGLAAVKSSQFRAYSRLRQLLRRSH